jgi:adenylosuccinate synthase
MANVVVVGAQWGDEGKGKIVDIYTEFADVVVRYGGGANAGHTLVVDGKKVILHLIPSGVLRAGKRCVLGDGVVVDPEVLLQEIEAVQSSGLLTDALDLRISSRAHVIFQYHRELDALRESRRGALGTTKRGIGPAYEAKVARRGIRMADLLHPDRLRERVEANLEEINPVIERLGGRAVEVEPIVAAGVAFGQRLAHHITDTSRFLDDERRKGRRLLFEGAQGTLLDVDHGTYPFVTSSNTIAGGACTGCGIGPTAIQGVIGVSKAYTTRVGAGPFPTELDDSTGEYLRKVGQEFGSTTGRPRRCGWLDGAALRLAARLNGLTGLALTKLDVLSGLPTLKICVGYRVDGQLRDELPIDPVEIEVAEPVYVEFEGWTGELRDVRDLDALPTAARRFVREIEAVSGVPVVLVSVGPGRAETITLRRPGT